MPSDVSEFYERALERNGVSAEAVGWKDRAAQIKRFRKLVKPWYGIESILDVGCGLGALAEHLQEVYPVWFNRIRYAGIDIMPEFIDVARARLGRYENMEMAMGARVFYETDVRQIMPADMEDHDHLRFDLVVASGALAHHHMPEKIEMLDEMWKATRHILAFNIKLQDADLKELALIMPRFKSGDWTIVHDYGLDEATIHVRKH